MSNSEQTFYNVWFKSAENPPPAGGESYRFEKSQLESLVSTLLGLKDTVVKLQAALGKYTGTGGAFKDTRILARNIHVLDYTDDNNPFIPGVTVDRQTSVDLVITQKSIRLVLVNNGALDFEAVYHEDGVQIDPVYRRWSGVNLPNDFPKRLTG